MVSRDVPLTTRLTAYFGGFFNQFGWFFFGFGLIFFWVFGLNADLSFFTFRGEISTTTGTVTDTLETNASSNDRPIFEIHYRYFDQNENQWYNFSYTTDRIFPAGQKVEVEYRAENPGDSRIKGLRSKMFGPYVLFVTLFPLIGLIFILAGLRKGLKAVKLLKYGRLARGVLVSKTSTSTSINDQTVYRLSFEFEDEYGSTQKIEEKTHLPHLLEDDREEMLLYLRHAPQQAVMIDTLPVNIAINEKDQIVFNSSLRPLWVMIIPLLTIGGHGLFILTAF